MADERKRSWHMPSGLITLSLVCVDEVLYCVCSGFTFAAAEMCNCSNYPNESSIPYENPTDYCRYLYSNPSTMWAMACSYFLFELVLILSTMLLVHGVLMGRKTLLIPYIIATLISIPACFNGLLFYDTSHSDYGFICALTVYQVCKPPNVARHYFDMVLFDKKRRVTVKPHEKAVPSLVKPKRSTDDSSHCICMTDCTALVHL